MKEHIFFILDYHPILVGIFIWEWETKQTNEQSGDVTASKIWGEEGSKFLRQNFVNISITTIQSSSMFLHFADFLGSDFLESWSSYIFGWTITKKQATKCEYKLPAYIHRWCFCTCIIGWDKTNKQTTKGTYIYKLPAYIHRWCFRRLQGPGSDFRLLPTLPKSNNRQFQTFSESLKVKAWKSSFPGSDSHYTTLTFSESLDKSLKGANKSKTPDASCI